MSATSTLHCFDFQGGEVGGLEQDEGHGLFPNLWFSVKTEFSSLVLKGA